MKSRSVTFFLLLGFGLLKSLSANAEFVVPALNSPVQDEVGVLSSRARSDLETVLRELHRKGRAQIQVLTIRSLEGLPIEMASIKIVEQWKLGSEKKDNGILVLLAVQDKKVRIEIGQGLEGDIPDAVANRIIRETMIPEFKQGDYSTGVVRGVLRLIQIIDSEIVQSQKPEEFHVESDGMSSSVELIFIILFVLFIIFGRFFGGRRFGRSHGLGGWGGGGWGGGGFGRGGGWGGGGGGFSGGGASGGW